MQSLHRLVSSFSHPCRRFIGSRKSLSLDSFAQHSTVILKGTNNASVSCFGLGCRKISAPAPVAFHTCSRLQCSADVVEETEADEGEEDVKREMGVNKGQMRPVHDVETSMRYMKSQAYKVVYGEDPVWKNYRRNYKGPHIRIPPPRKMCVRGGVVATGNPCPVCRDEYLVVHYKNVGLLEQFVSPYTNQVLDNVKTGVCQREHRNLLVAVEKARDYGYLEPTIPFREYTYQDYYPGWTDSSTAE